MKASRIDVADVLKTSVLTWWRDFAPITLLGLALLILPELTLQALGAPNSEGRSTQTLVTTMRALTLLMFFSAVSAATLASASALPVKTYMLVGLKRIQPPLVAALCVAAGLVGILILQRVILLAAGPAISLIAVPLFATALVLWLLAMPVAAASGVAPLAAIRLSQRLALANKGPMFGIVTVALLGVLPPLMLLSTILYGINPAPARIAEISAAMTPATAGFWVAELASVLLFGLMAVLPPTLYHALVTSQT